MVSFLPLAPVLSLLPIILRWFSIWISSPPLPLILLFCFLPFFCFLLVSVVMLSTSINFLTIWNFFEHRIIVPLFKMLDMLLANGCFELFTQDERYNQKMEVCNMQSVLILTILNLFVSFFPLFSTIIRHSLANNHSKRSPWEWKHWFKISWHSFAIFLQRCQCYVLWECQSHLQKTESWMIFIWKG